jgi:hypothetical protein
MGFLSKLTRAVKAVFDIFRSDEDDELIRQSKNKVVRQSKVEDPLEKFKNENRNVIDAANQLLNQLENRELSQYSSAYEKAMASGGRFNIDKAKTKEEVVREVLRAEEFTHNPMSTPEFAEGMRKLEVGEETVKELKESGVDLYNTRIHEDNIVKDFWEAVDRVREEDGIRGRLTELEYSRDAAYGYAFNIWVQSGFDQGSLKDAIKEFISEQDFKHETNYEAAKGKAVFESEDDF